MLSTVILIVSLSLLVLAIVFRKRGPRPTVFREPLVEERREHIRVPSELIEPLEEVNDEEGSISCPKIFPKIEEAKVEARKRNRVTSGWDAKPAVSQEQRIYLYLEVTASPRKVSSVFAALDGLKDPEITYTYTCDTVRRAPNQAPKLRVVQ